MKILIMVLSSPKPPYDSLMKSQKETWDSIKVDNVETVYYYGAYCPDGACYPYPDLVFNCSDEYNMMHWKFKLALDAVWDWNWDMIFKTNSSSYVDKKLLLEKAHNLPLTECYCGIDGGKFASGSGAFLSRDVAKIIKDSLTIESHPYEDVCIGQLLEQHGINVTKGAERFDCYNMDQIDENHYHYRCVIDKIDRTKDVQLFKKIIQKKTNG